MNSVLRKIIAVMMTIIIIAGIFSISGLALTSDYENPLTVEIIAKDSYSLMETGSITIKATNAGNSDLNNVVITADSDDLLFLNKNGQKSYSVGKLEKGKSATWTVQVILSSNCNGLGFFQRLLLTFKKWFTPCSAFDKGYENREQAITMSNKQINYGGFNANVNAYAFFDSSTLIVNADDIASFVSALSVLVTEHQNSSTFSASEAKTNKYYSQRVIIKGDDINFNDYDPDTIINGPDNLYIVQFDSEKEAKEFVSDQSEKSSVQFVEPDIYVFLDPIESTAGTNSNISTSAVYNSWGVEHIQADQYAAYLKRENKNNPITIAVIDSGIDNTNPLFAGKIVQGYDFIDDDNKPFVSGEDYRRIIEETYYYPYGPIKDSGHGTHVAGTIIDCMPDLNARIMPLRVFDLYGEGCSMAVLTGAIDYAAEKGAKVINMSLGGPFISDALDNSINNAIKEGVTVCVSAGNDSKDTKNYSPASNSTSGCICVAAIDQSNQKAYFSNFGSAVEVAAPGVSIKSCVPGGTDELWNGTSMAAPHVSACAAMIKMNNPNLSPAQIENYIRQYTQDIGTVGRDNYFGYGVPKMSKAIPKTDYTITYNANGGSVSPSSATVESGSSVSLPTPTRSYTITYNVNSGSVAPSNQNLNASCKGWSTSFSATTASYNCGSSYTPMSSITLYAVWGNATGSVTTAKPTRSGYSFAGWSTSSSATAVEYTAGSSISINRNVTLYAVWSRNPSTYTITYNANGGSNPPASQTKTENIDLVLSTVMPTRTGYTFLGWSTNNSATSPTYPAGGTYTANASATLYAVWKINTYTISYNANGGSGAPSSQTKTYGQSLTLSSTKPTRTGYDFLGWSTSSSATSATYSAGGTYTSNSSATLYAVWKIKTYTISYNANGGSGAPSSQTKTYGQNLTLSSTEPTRSGYNFKGWSTSSSATSATYSKGGIYSTNSSATLYAVWAKQEVYLNTYSSSITTSRVPVTVTNSNYGHAGTACEYYDGTFNGFRVPLPSVTVVGGEYPCCPWYCDNGPWSVIGGNAVIMNYNGVDYLCVSGSGTYTLRYFNSGSSSADYTYRVTLT